MTSQEIIAEIDDNYGEAEIKYAIGEIKAAESSLKRNSYTSDQRVDAASYDLSGVVASLEAALKENAKLRAKLRKTADVLAVANGGYMVKSPEIAVTFGCQPSELLGNTFATTRDGAMDVLSRLWMQPADALKAKGFRAARVLIIEV